MRTLIEFGTKRCNEILKSALMHHGFRFCDVAQIYVIIVNL